MDTLTNQASAPKEFSTRRVFLVSLISSLILSALVAIFVFLIGNFGDTEVRLLLTTLTIGGYSLTGLCSSMLYDKNKYAGFAVLGIIVAVFGFLVTVGVIWEVFELDETWKAALIFMVLSFSIAHSS